MVNNFKFQEDRNPIKVKSGGGWVKARKTTQRDWKMVFQISKELLIKSNVWDHYYLSITEDQDVLSAKFWWEYGRTRHIDVNSREGA